MFIAFPSPRGVQGYPTRRSAYVKYGRTTRFRPLAGFKVIQLGEAHREVGHDHLVSVPSRGSRLSNAITRKAISLAFMFPSPRGVQGYPTRDHVRRIRPVLQVSVPSRGSRLSNSLDVSGQLC